MSVIWVKVVAPEKLLNVNTFPKIPWCRFHYLHYLKISLCWYGQFRYPKILYIDLGLSVKTKITVLDFKPTPFSLPLSMFSPSLPNPQYLILSLSVFRLFPHYVLPAVISHKKRMMFKYDYHCLIDNKSLQMHLLFHLSPLNTIQSISSRDSILCKEWSLVQTPLNGETIIGLLDKCFFLKQVFNMSKAR